MIALRVARRAGKPGAGLFVLIAVGMWSVALMVGPGAGAAFAWSIPGPSIPVSMLPTATTGLVDGTVATATVAGADAAAGSAAVGAVGVCGAMTAGTCALAAVAAVGVAYGTYKLIHWAWGAQHTAYVSNAPVTSPQYATTTYGSGSSPSWTISVGLPSGDPSSGTVQWSESGSSGGQVSMWFSCTSGAGPQIQPTGGMTGSFSFSCGAGYVLSQVVANLLSGGQSYGTVTLTPKSTGSCSWGTSAGFSPTGGTCTTPPPPPSHTVKFDIQCVGSDGTITHITYTSSSFTDADTAPPDMSPPSCALGTTPGGQTITETNPNGPDTPLYTIPAPKIAGSPCGVVGAGCSPHFQSAQGGLWVDDFGESPSNKLEGDPGFRCEWMSPDGSIDGGALPMTDCVAGIPPAGDPVPTPTPTPFGPPKTPPTPDENACFPSGWGMLNPLEWVYRPVMCALRDAFIPSQQALDDTATQVQHSWDTTPPGVMVGTVGKLAAPLGGIPTSDSGCQGPELKFTLPPMFTGDVSRTNDWHPFSMCNAVGEWVHTWWMPFATALVYLGSVLIAAKIVGGTMGWHHHLNPTVDEL